MVDAMRTMTLPSHIALSCSGVLTIPGTVVPVCGLFSSTTGWNDGLKSTPTLLGICALPPVIAEKSTPMNRSIMSCATCGRSKGTMWDELKIWVTKF